MSRPRLAGILASVALVLIALALAVVGGEGGGDDAAAGIAARIVTADDLKSLEAELGHAIYWAGDRSPDQLELREEVDGSVYLRYLSPGAEAGDPRVTFLTVGTYPVAGAQAALRRTAHADGGRIEPLEDGAIALVDPSSPGSTYLAYPESDIEIEVYDPEPGRSLDLIRSGAIGPVGQ